MTGRPPPPARRGHRAATDLAPSAGLLAGVTVVELGDGVAGAVAASTLAALGATVVAGARPTRGPARHGPLVPDGSPAGASALVATLDRGKRVVPHDEAVALGADADIVIVDGVDGDADDGAGPVGAPVTVVITPFGLDGPRAGHRGGELVAAAAGGLLGTIEPEGGGRPVSPPGFVALRATGSVAALAALHGLDAARAAVRGAAARGPGVDGGPAGAGAGPTRDGPAPVLVDVSAQEAVAFTAAVPECAHVLFACPGRAGSGRYVAPSGIFPCADGYIRIAAVEDHQWKGMVECLEAPTWTEGLEGRPARVERAEEITANVAAWTAIREKAACADLLQRHGVPATGVNDPPELLRSPQLTHRRSYVRLPVGPAEVDVLGPPWRLELDDVARGDGPPSLADLRVVELTHVLAGPIVGALLGGMGARVVRIEDRDRLDIYRRTGPFADGVAGTERGAYFAVANVAKASVAVDAADAGSVASQLLDRAHVLIENVGRSRLDRLGVDPAQRSADGLLSLRVSGFGSDGPLAGYRVYANNVQSYGGLAWLTRDHQGDLARVGTVLADPLSSVVGATVVAAWVLGPQRVRGGVADLSMAEVVAGTVAEFVAATAAGLEVEPPVGNDLAPFAPHGVYTGADDRWLAVSVQSDDDWAALVAALGAPEALDRPGWSGAAARWADRKAIDAALDALAADHDVDRLAAQLSAAGVRAAPVQRGADLVADPHLAARGFFPEVAHPDLGTARVVGLPWRFAGAGPIPLAGAPALGSTTTDDLWEDSRDH